MRSVQATHFVKRAGTASGPLPSAGEASSRSESRETKTTQTITVRQYSSTTSRSRRRSWPARGGYPANAHTRIARTANQPKDRRRSPQSGFGGNHVHGAREASRDPTRLNECRGAQPATALRTAEAQLPPRAAARSPDRAWARFRPRRPTSRCPTRLQRRCRQPPRESKLPHSSCLRARPLPLG